MREQPEIFDSAVMTRQEGLCLLSVREVEVLSLLADGKSNKEIASELGISPSTAKSHVASILRVLNLDSRTLAAVFWTEALHER